ncbi:hypothetical protein LPJ78_002390 [Coemansia sp. RSA 989]|nr:hypothetical protein LPJ68_001926 [Coemansia sp. RSA 1086]KAJ1752780.1 hypothetical protein LPJ79_000916 [Coemansia sp. RSA 1821]KAJ1865797.1 hypothetical protein LPJ78_002390 [Coemansia sp. RSA 989]KAJ1875192.1 hypothetical protein LPJ55_000864 [Coemansia sp. RSA 990]KAJ2650590.1 hypothetical protein IWW40_002327 [Coemansia sp. RSA 1250]KAJ2671871.1 hypothetical protein IWW42_003133 [Coemansia sp. RSA 1085]
MPIENREQNEAPLASTSETRRQHRHHHHRHGRRPSQRRASRVSIRYVDDNSDSYSSEGTYSESGSASCSTASSCSADHTGARRHRHHSRRSRRHERSRRTSMQNPALGAPRRSMGRRLQVEFDREPSDDSSEREQRRRRSTSDGSSSSAAIEQPDEDGSNVRARQEALNTRHPFGLPIWKPALYKKSRSVTRAAFMALHARPLRSARQYLKPGNIAWMLLAGWWLLIVSWIIAGLLIVVPRGGRQYARVAAGLGWYLLWPFGRYVERIKEGQQSWTESAPIQLANSDDEDAPLLSGQTTPGPRYSVQQQRETVLGRAVFYMLLVTVLNPALIVVSALSWFAVFSIPMGKLTHTLARYLWRDPLSLHFRAGDFPTVKVANEDDAAEEAEEPAPTVLLCTNDAVGWYYYKYTVDGVNILFYDMLALAVFVLIAAFVIAPLTDHKHFLVQPAVLFPMCLLSTVPLAYFIGQAVSSISAQSSLGMGAVINATFGSIVEVILYSIALTQGKSQLVEGALIGSLLAGLMLMPGTSMIAGGIKHKVQRFNAKSAEVTATLVIMSIIGAFAPTLFYITFAVPEFECQDEDTDMRRCRQINSDFLDDPFYQQTVRPFMYFCTAILPLSYLIALWFSLKTHVKHIYSSGHTTNPILRHVLELFRRTVGPDATTRLNQRLHRSRPVQPAPADAEPQVSRGDVQEPEAISGEQDETALLPTGQRMSSSRLSRSPSYYTYNPADAPSSLANVPRLSEVPRVLAADPDDQLPDLGLLERVADGEGAADGGGHGHDAPNWSKAKSAFILCTCTVIFSLIAEVLVDTVDVVIQGLGIKEKYIGLTLFALVPNVTEFLNAIAFAIQNNIALSIEISNAYTVQVALLQIPILVAFSAFYGVPDFVTSPAHGLRELAVRWMSQPSSVRKLANHHLPTEPSAYVFALLFPQWDLIAILFCVFLLTYMLIEGKANYFKGSILCLSYFVWLVGYAFVPARE